MALPPSVVEEDYRLETATTKASEALAQHRWHWTLDESNPDRVSIREYAREASRNYTTIHAYAHGWKLFQADRGATINEAMERAKMSSETETATAAVAEARGTSFGHTRQSRPTEVRRVRDIARERAEKRGTSIEEEAPRIAESIVNVERAGREITARRNDARSLRYVEMERHISAAIRRLTDALRVAQDVGFDDEEVALITHSVAQARLVLNLIDKRLAGAAGVDWDAELAKLTKED